METFDLKKITEEIRQKHSITEKLDYWLKIKTKYIDEPLKEIESEFILANEKNRHQLFTSLFGEDYKLVSPLRIPKHIYDEHFENGLNEPEFTYWFLKYNARKWFEDTYKIRKLDKKLKAPKSKQYIAAILNKINELDDKVNDLLSHGMIGNSFIDPIYKMEIELLRIQDGYYENNTLHSVHSVGNDTVILYAEHKYLKEYLTPTIEINYTRFNKAEIAEYTSCQDFNLDHIKIRIIETVEGFAVYLSRKDFAENYFIDAKLDLEGKQIEEVFELYFQSSFANHLKKTKTIYKLSENDFKEYLSQKEYDFLEKFKTSINYFAKDVEQFFLLKKCTEFIEWLKPQQIKVKNKSKSETKLQLSFPEYLVHKKKEQLAQKLKEKFTDLSGQNEAALCYCLVDIGLLDTKELDRTKIHKLFKYYFKDAGIIEQAKNITNYLDEYYKYEKNIKTKKFDSKIKGFKITIRLIMSNIK